MKPQFKIIILLIALFAALPLGHAETVDRIVAKVGGDAITLSDVSRTLKQQKTILVQRLGQTAGMDAYRKYEKDVVNELVLEKILQQEIEREQIVISPSEIDQEFSERARQTGMTEAEFSSKIVAAGLSVLDYKDSIKKDLGRQQFVQKKIIPKMAISDFDLQKEYQKNISEFQAYKRIHFVEVFLTPEKFTSVDEMMKVAQDLQSRLHKGQLPTDLIKKYSSGAFADKGGDTGMIDASELRPDLQKLLSRLNKGETSKLLPVGNGVFIFKVLEKADPQPIPFNEVMSVLRNRVGDRYVIDELKRYLMNVKDQTYVEVFPH